jgi:IPT/TIG domain/FHA domain
VADDQPDRVSVPTLVMTGGPLDGTAYPLSLTDGETLLGSSTEAGVQITLGNVEPVHARILLGRAGLAIEDAGSATGTFVNGEKVEGHHTLENGDRICLGPPGAKGSAKLLVRLPGVSSPALAADAGAPALFGEHLAIPSLGDEGPTLAFTTAGEVGVPQEFDLSADARSVVADVASGPPLEATEVPPAEEEGDALFAAPLPPAAPHEPARPAPSAPPPPPLSFTAPPPPPPPPSFTSPPAQPPPPAPPPPAADRLTAPPRPELPRTEAPKPEYQTELPSIPIARQAEPPTQSEFPPLRPAPRPTARPATKGKGRTPGRRRRSFSLPSIPILPILGSAAGLATVAGLVWFFFLRGTPPEVTSIAPESVETGQKVTLTGKHFAGVAAGNTVLFGQAKAQVTAAGPTTLEAVVPAGVKARVPVVVQTKGGRSTPVNVTVQATAKASGLEPDVTLPGQVVVVRGEGFEGQKLTAQVAGVAAAAVESTAEGVRVTIPALPLAEGSKTSLVIKAGTSPPRSFDLYIGHLPLVIEVIPQHGAVGERVVLKGRGFRPDALANAVTFAGQPALVVSATATELAVIAPPPPAGEVLPELPIVVTVAGRASAGTSAYALVRAAGAGFVPRFFAAPVTEAPGEGLAFVSTELGPLLVLGGPAGAPSTADRAVRVSAALNALVAGATSRPPAFELRERPQPSVGVAGEVSPFLVPTPEDAAAYSRNWETGRGAGRRVAPAAVARHWAALLQDYFGLFLYRQRPLKMVALSPRGKVLTEIYGEANRRAPGGTNVPTGLVLPTPASMASALRQMALVVSAEAGRAAVAVEGRWDGTIEDPDLGTRRFELQLRSEGGRLAGTLTTWRGKIELKAPVREIGFDRGDVRFTVDQQGTAYHFKGTLEGNTVSGTIERTGKAPAKFTLQFVE